MRPRSTRYYLTSLRAQSPSSCPSLRAEHTLRKFTMKFFVESMSACCSRICGGTIGILVLRFVRPRLGFCSPQESLLKSL